MDVCELGLAHHSFPKEILRKWPLGWMAIGMNSVSRLCRGELTTFKNTSCMPIPVDVR